MQKNTKKQLLRDTLMNQKSIMFSTIIFTRANMGLLGKKKMTFV